MFLVEADWGYCLKLFKQSEQYIFHRKILIRDILKYFKVESPTPVLKISWYYFLVTMGFRIELNIKLSLQIYNTMVMVLQIKINNSINWKGRQLHIDEIIFQLYPLTILMIFYIWCNKDRSIRWNYKKNYKNWSFKYFSISVGDKNTQYLKKVI